ncbi:MAG: BlaI/MecI/CopY family transcriptional regulator [Limisphaerales bacterium]
MKKTKLYRLGDLQLQILQALWERREATVAGVLAALGRDAGLAYTTIATMLRRMEARGLVAHRAEGRTFVYRAAVAAETVTRGMADHLLDRLFEGNLADMVSHLLTTREVSLDELRQLERLIAERRRRK